MKPICYLPLLVPFLLHGQNSIAELPQVAGALSAFQGQQAFHVQQTPGHLQESSIIWGEDFANGIPTDWINEGRFPNGNLDTNQQWEFRGPNTLPNNTTGSRGFFSSSLGPISAATSTNGFVIFDSDYLDNNGIQNNLGNGLSASPHHGQLTTGLIDVSAHTQIVLSFQQYYRRLNGPVGMTSSPATFIEFSTDGGTTFGNRTPVNEIIISNSMTPNNDVVLLDVSGIIGGQSAVKIRFVFEGSYYFWMLDDISLLTKPKHALFFATIDNKPPQKILFGATNATEPAYGHLKDWQCRDIHFSANAYNFGSQLQTFVKLKVAVLDPLDSIIFSTESATIPVLFSGDSLFAHDLQTTTPWATCNYPEGTYQIVYTLVSDSVPLQAGALQPIDTFTMTITNDEMGLHFAENATNEIGTNNNFGLDDISFGVAMHLSRYDVATHTSAWLSSRTVPGGEIEACIYPAMGFNFTDGFLLPPVICSTHTITQADVDSQRVALYFLDNNNRYPILLDEDYYLVYTLKSNNGANPIFLGNDASFFQEGASSIFYINRSDGTSGWLTNFTNSASFSAPLLSMHFCVSDPNISCNMSTQNPIDEIAQVYPNPAKEEFVLDFSAGNGMYDVRLVDVMGQEVMVDEIAATGGHKAYFSVQQLPSGVYLLQIQSEDGRQRVERIVVRR